jgi:hypothetical protein
MDGIDGAIQGEVGCCGFHGVLVSCHRRRGCLCSIHDHQSGVEGEIVQIVFGALILLQP